MFTRRKIYPTAPLHLEGDDYGGDDYIEPTTYVVADFKNNMLFYFTANDDAENDSISMLRDITGEPHNVDNLGEDFLNNKGAWARLNYELTSGRVHDKLLILSVDEDSLRNKGEIDMDAIVDGIIQGVEPDRWDIMGLSYFITTTSSTPIAAYRITPKQGSRARGSRDHSYDLTKLSPKELIRQLKNMMKDLRTEPQEITDDDVPK